MGDKIVHQFHFHAMFNEILKFLSWKYMLQRDKKATHNKVIFRNYKK
jgi:hypothetical protein